MAPLAAVDKLGMFAERICACAYVGGAIPCPRFETASPGYIAGAPGNLNSITNRRQVYVRMFEWNVQRQCFLMPKY